MNDQVNVPELLLKLSAAEKDRDQLKAQLAAMREVVRTAFTETRLLSNKLLEAGNNAMEVKPCE